MSNYQQRDDSGSLFRVADRKSEKHPEFEGEFKLCCPNCSASFGGWVKAWVKQGKESKFFSLAFKAKQKRDAA